MVGQLVQRQDFDLIVRKIGFRQVRTLLQHDYAKSMARKFLGENATGRPGSHDHKVHFVGSLVTWLVHHHVLSASFAADCQPG